MADTTNITLITLYTNIRGMVTLYSVTSKCKFGRLRLKILAVLVVSEKVLLEMFQLLVIKLQIQNIMFQCLCD